MNRAVGIGRRHPGGEPVHAACERAQGARPSYNDAARPESARRLYDEFVLQLQTALGRRVQTGKFGAL